MKKNNIIITIVLIAFVVCIGLVLYFRLSDKDDEEVIINVDLKLLETNIASETMFGETTMQSVDKEVLLSKFGIEENTVEDVIGKLPLINVQASMYVIVKATSGNVDYIMGKFEKYGIDYEEQWKRYLPEQYELVKKRKIGSKGDYVYFVVSDSADEILEMIK